VKKKQNSKAIVLIYFLILATRNKPNQTQKNQINLNTLLSIQKRGLQEYLYEVFKENQEIAILISFGIGIVIAILGVVPSFFLTAANILFFGFWPGTLLSFFTEALGNMFAFYLYRKGFREKFSNKIGQYKKLNQLLLAGNREAFWLILALRIFPFVPSGLVSFASAIGKVSAPVFFIASSIGKIPAILLEASAVYGFLQSDWKIKIFIAFIATLIILIILFRLNKKEKN